MAANRITCLMRYLVLQLVLLIACALILGSRNTSGKTISTPRIEFFASLEANGCPISRLRFHLNDRMPVRLTPVESRMLSELVLAQDAESCNKLLNTLLTAAISKDKRVLSELHAQFDRNELVGQRLAAVDEGWRAYLRTHQQSTMPVNTIDNNYVAQATRPIGLGIFGIILWLVYACVKRKDISWQPTTVAVGVAIVFLWFIKSNVVMICGMTTLSLLIVWKWQLSVAVLAGILACIQADHDLVDEPALSQSTAVTIAENVKKDGPLLRYTYIDGKVAGQSMTDGRTWTSTDFRLQYDTKNVTKHRIVGNKAMLVSWLKLVALMLFVGSAIVLHYNRAIAVSLTLGYVCLAIVVLVTFRQYVIEPSYLWISVALCILQAFLIRQHWNAKNASARTVAPT